MIRRVLRSANPMKLLEQMDLGRWLAVGAIGCAAIVTWALPARTHEFRTGYQTDDFPTPVEREHRAALRAAVDLNARLVREAWLETMLDRAAESKGDELVTWLPEAMPRPLARTLETTFGNAFRAAAGLSPTVTTGYFIVGHNQGGHPALAMMDPYGSDETYLGEIEGRPYCFTGRKLRNFETIDFEQLQGVADSQNRALRALGTCGFYAKYGVPGGPLSAWLAAGGYRYADFVFSDRFPRTGFISAKGRFGRNGQGIALPKQACASGSKEACEMLFLQPFEAGPTARVYTRGNRHPPVAAYSDGGHAWFDMAILGWLEQEYGEEAFAEFWSSELPVKEAFEAAYPVTLEIWMRDFTVRMIGPVQAGPAPSSANVFGSLLFVAAGILFSLFVSRRSNPRHT